MGVMIVVYHRYGRPPQARGATGIVGIGRKFRIVDKNKSGTVDLAEFTQMINGLYELVFSLSQICST